MRRFLFLFFCALSFDLSASFRAETEIYPYLDLDKLSYKKNIKLDTNDSVTFEVPLVEEYVSDVDRLEELKKCKYLTGAELLQDWEGYFDQGNRDWINQSRVIVFDTEVNNTSFEGEIIQISLSETINNKDTGLIFNTFVRPHSRKFSKYSSKVHGITWEQLQDKPYFLQIASQMKDFIGDSLVVAHNAAFDVRMLSQEYERLAQTIPFKILYKCTLQMHRRDEKRALKNVQVLSPLKKKHVQYILPEERAEIIKEKREQNKKARIKTKGVTKTIRKTPITPIIVKTSMASLGCYIKVCGLNSKNVIVILKLRSPKKGKLGQRRDKRDIGHHDALFDTFVARVKLLSFDQEKILAHIKEEIHFSQESQDSLSGGSSSSDNDGDSFMDDDDSDKENAFPAPSSDDDFLSQDSSGGFFSDDSEDGLAFLNRCMG